MQFTLYTANCTGDNKNCSYPNAVLVQSPADLAVAAARDHVTAKYENNYRGSENFLKAVVLPMDCDNDHSENPDEWITPEKLATDYLGDVSFVATPSRHNMLQKGSYGPRPRHHYLFMINLCKSAEAYAGLKRRIYEAFPFFDDNALDAARLLYGCQMKAEDIFWNEGWMSIEDVLEDLTVDTPATAEADSGSSNGAIMEGTRNKTMNHFAGRVLKRYGLTDKAYAVYMEHSKKCDPPLPETELQTIWESACKFYRNKVMTQESYVAPDQYNAEFTDSLKPKDYSDIGQARVLAEEYGAELIYTSATDFLRYDGTVWVEDKQLAVGATVEFLDLQLQDATDLLLSAKEELKAAGISDEVIAGGAKKIEKEIETEEQQKAFKHYVAAAQYFAFVMKRRDMKYITSAMNVAKALLNHDINEMDGDPFLLNTPEATYDLKKGMTGAMEHDPDHKITKLTEVSPGDTGSQLWEDALQLFFCKDTDLIHYVQRVVGMAAVGQVFQEHLIIAYGDGANGKSTFWNTVARVLGRYSGKLSPEILTVGNKRNAKPEMAELKGKRLIIASETEEGMRLNTGMVKQLSSTDPIQAEKKYEKPFDFIPSHTVVLYTNHLPRVGANDDGIWRRLIVIPFAAKITGSSDIKNYADYLFENAGPAIMKWIIEGAQDAISCDFIWPLPSQVENAIREYREQNDWFAQFIEDCCEIGDGFQEASGRFYDEYRNYCVRVGEYTRNSADFYAALEKAGFRRKRTKSNRLVLGIQLKSDFLE